MLHAAIRFGSGGEGGPAMLCRREAGQWANQACVTCELAYHGDQNAPRVVGAAGADVNSDGRQGVALFCAERKPMLFFNRGFACSAGRGSWTWPARPRP